jgi:hypothetical protein
LFLLNAAGERNVQMNILDYIANEEIETETETTNEKELPVPSHCCNINDRTWFGLCPECGEKIEYY